VSWTLRGLGEPANGQTPQHDRRLTETFGMPRLFSLEWAPQAKMELDTLRSFDRPAIRRAVDELQHQALVETTNRKPLQAALSALPDATWQIRVGRHRVLYRVDDRTVRILRVILKVGTTGGSV
jgi:mRNA-degrading endonuclease RelE of RelBE toxin-antitoxin system